MLFNPNAKYYKGDVVSAPNGIHKKVRALLLEIQYTQCPQSRTCTRTSPSPSPSYPYSAQCGNVLVLYTHSSACVVTSLTARASRIRDFPSRAPLLSSPLLSSRASLLSSSRALLSSPLFARSSPLSRAPLLSSPRALLSSPRALLSSPFVARSSPLLRAIRRAHSHPIPFLSLSRTHAHAHTKRTRPVLASPEDTRAAHCQSHSSAARSTMLIDAMRERV